MLEELERLIKFIEQEYFEFNKQWKESNYYYEINLRKKTINDRNYGRKTESSGRI